jgi:hypothetical protein
MAAAKKDQGDVLERLEKTIEGILDKRDQRQKEAADPKARFDRVMDRLEGFLDGLEEGEKKEPKDKPEPKKGGGVIEAIFGAEEAS